LGGLLTRPERKKKATKKINPEDLGSPAKRASGAKGGGGGKAPRKGVGL